MRPSIAEALQTTAPKRAAFSVAAYPSIFLAAAPFERDRPAADAGANRREQARQGLRRRGDGLDLHAFDLGLVALGAKPQDLARRGVVEARRLIQRQTLEQRRPMFGEAGADQQHDIGARSSLGRSGDEHAEGARHVEIVENLVRREMVISAAQPLGEQNRGARAGRVGREPRDHWKFRAAQDFRGVSIGVLYSDRRPVERCFAHS